jgi:imidazoleglycerol phosphate synthase cyclase subunit
MVTTRVIPCLDVHDGRVVKGVKFQGLRDAGDPAERAEVYERQGADEIALLDVSATLESRAARLETVRRVRERLSIPLTVGGGVRQTADAEALLEAGADKVSVNTAAVERPELLAEMAERFGRQCTVIAIDAVRAASGWETIVRSGRDSTGVDAVSWAREATRDHAGEILLTSWDRDGTRSGYELELLSRVAAAVGVPVIASGGASAPADLLAALEAGADAVLAASIFHDGNYSIGQVKTYLQSQGVRIRQ